MSPYKKKLKKEQRGVREIKEKDVQLHTTTGIIVHASMAYF